VIVRQMLRKVTIDEPGDSEFLPGEMIDRFIINEVNAELLAEGGEPSTPRRRFSASPRRPSRPNRSCRRPPSRRRPAC
jgi:hypothetical protein